MARTKKETNTPTHIIDNYYMDADSHQYILVEKVQRTKKESGDTYEGTITHGYYISVEGLLKALVGIYTRTKIKSNELPTIKGVVAELINITSRLENILCDMSENS